LLSTQRIDSKFLFLASKLSLTGGAALAVAGAIVSGHAELFLGLEAIGILTIVGGLYLRKKASSLRRRFDWRDGHVPA
jgi:hypothetical protein